MLDSPTLDCRLRSPGTVDRAVDGTVAEVSSAEPSYAPVAERAVLVDFGTDVDESVIGRVSALDAALAASPPAGLVELVPAMTSLLVVFDPTETDHTEIVRVVRERLEAGRRTTTGRHHVVDVCYGAGFGPDLADVAEAVDLTPQEVVERHRSVRYRVATYGFAPGYAYLFGTPTRIAVPRRTTPGPVVPAGSVIITGRQCLVIPVPMSTGWFAIGRSPTPVVIDDPERPFRFDVGDTVEFRSIPPTEFPT